MFAAHSCHDVIHSCRAYAFYFGHADHVSYSIDASSQIMQFFQVIKILQIIPATNIFKLSGSRQ